MTDPLPIRHSSAHAGPRDRYWLENDWPTFDAALPPIVYLPMEPEPDRRPAAFRRETVATVRAEWWASKNTGESWEQR